MGVSLAATKRPRGAQSADYTSTNLAQTEAESDPGYAGHDEIDAKEHAEDIEARDRPVRQNQQAEQQRDRAGQQHPDPGRFPFHAEGQDDPHDAAGQQRCAENEGEQRGGEQWILERDEARDDVEHTEQDPEQEFAPALDLEGAEYFGDAGDDHHRADDENARDSGQHDAAKRDKPGDEIDDAERDDPARLGAPRRRIRTDWRIVQGV